MSIVLKGVDMPERCQDCPCATCWDLYKYSTICAADEKEPDIIYDAILPSCPAVQLPKKHGRLIDADELLERLKESGNYVSPAVLSYIETAPTIIEAEDGDDQRDTDSQRA